jgi:V/A-type H+-transporting ATPase subunit C
MPFHGLNAKLQAMRAHRLSPADYDILCRYPTLEAAVAYLREKTVYRAVLTDLTQPPHRVYLERRLYQCLFGEYHRLRKHVHTKVYRDCLDAVFMQYELDVVKSLLCMVFDHREIDMAPSELALELNILFAGHLLDIAKLASSQTVPEFIEQLAGTVLYRVLKDAYAKQPTLFALEQQLDLHYYLRLWKMKGVDKRNGLVLERVMGTEIDLRNIVWMYRLKKYYDVHGPDLYAHLIPVHHRLTRADIRRMAENDMEGFKKEVAAGPYRAVFAPGYGNPDRDMGLALSRLRHREAKRNPDTLAGAIAYLSDKAREISQITAILEGIRYERPPEEIREFIN